MKGSSNKWSWPRNMQSLIYSGTSSTMMLFCCRSDSLIVTFFCTHSTLERSWRMNWVHVSIQLWTTLGKRLLRRGVKWSTGLGTEGASFLCMFEIPLLSAWLILWRWLFHPAGMACRHAGRFNEGSGFKASFCWKGRACSKEHNLRILSWTV